MSYPVESGPDENEGILGAQNAILAPQQLRSGMTVTALLLGCSALLGVLSQWLGAAPGIYAILFGVGGLVTAVVTIDRGISENKPKLWLKGNTLEYRQPNGNTALFNLRSLGGAFVTVESPSTYTFRVYLNFRTKDEEEAFRETGFNPLVRNHAPRIPMAGVVGIDSLQAQYFADEINRRRDLVYKWRTR